MAQESEFQSQNNPLDGVDEAAEAFFNLERRKQAIARGEDPDNPETPAKPAADPPDALELKLDDIVKNPPKEEELEDGPGEPKEGQDDPGSQDPADLQGEQGEQDEGEAELTPETEIELPTGDTHTLRELQEGYMRQSDYTAKTMELAEHRKQFAAKVDEAYQAFEERVQANTQLAQQLQAHMAGLMPNAQEMERLRQVDPGEYAARMEDLRAKQAAIAQAQAAKEAAEQEANRRLDEQRAARIPAERKALGEAIPAFKKDFDREYAALGRYVTASDGGRLRPEEWDLVDDHRYVTLVWKAREYDKATRKTAPAVRRKMASKPRAVRSGSRPDAGETQRNAVDAAMANLKANPDSREAAAAVFLAREQAKRADGPAARRRV